MPKPYDIVFWQNIPSLHQAPLMRALTARLGKRVLVVVADDIPADRLAMGWEKIDYGDADLIVEPSAEKRMKLVEENRDAIAHVFSGVGAYRPVADAMALLARGSHNHIAIVTEPWDPRGLRGRLRALKFGSRRHSLRKIDTLFACGILAGEQFTSLGCDLGKVAQFGYFVDGPAGDLVTPEAGKPSMIFVGTFTRWKDPATLIRALAMTPKDSWQLTMVGDGPLRVRSIQMVEELNLTHRVTFVQSMPNKSVLDSIRLSDLLVLPSKYDGWGAVVNEALMSGTPVVVSRDCGASDLVRDSLQGEVVAPGHASELARAFDRRLRTLPTTCESRKERLDWALDSISPSAAAQYLWNTVTREHGSPIPPAPWSETA